MTEPERQTVIEYIRWVANELELRDWSFDLMTRPCDRDAFATIWPTFGRKHAEIYLDESFRMLAPEKQRHIIIHELVHCHLEPATNMVYKDIEQVIGKPADLVFWNGFKRQIEYGIDAIATALASHMPLIAWPEG